jgi:hypothetical protein
MAPPPAALHQWCSQEASEDDRLQVDIEHAPPLVQVALRKARRTDGDSSVVVQDVEAAEGRYRGLHHVPRLLGVSHIDAHRGGASASAFDHPNRFARPGFIEVGRQHAGALGCQPHGRSPADPRSAAGNDGGLTFDVHI